MRSMLIGILAVNLGCKQEHPPEPARIRPVRVMKVLSTGSGRVRKLAGMSRAGVSSTMSFKVAGTLMDVAVKIGDRVDKGQMIAKLDPKDFELQVQEARAALAQAKAQARNAKSSYDRVRALWESQNASRGELDSARAGFETANAAASSVAKRLQLAQRQLDYCTLSAPVAGAIAAVTAEKNENVGAGQPIAMLTSGSQAEVRIEVPEMLIARISQGSKVTVSFDALPGKKFDALVTEVGVAPMTGATTFPVTVRLEGDTKDVRPGLAAEVELRFEAVGPKNRFIVPAFSVQSDAKGAFVFIAERGEPGKVTRRKVEIGDLTTEGLEVKSGIADGDLIVTAGVTKLKDGQAVRVPDVE